MRVPPGIFPRKLDIIYLDGGKDMIGTDNLTKLSPREFIEFLKQEKIPRFYFIYDPKK